MQKMRGLENISQEKLAVKYQTEQIIEGIIHFHRIHQVTFT